MSDFVVHGQFGAYELSELCRQPYRNCVFSAGFANGHPVDTLYLRFEREDEEPTTWLLRPDEAAAVAWCLTGALWSEQMRRMEPGEEAGE